MKHLKLIIAVLTIFSLTSCMEYDDDGLPDIGDGDTENPDVDCAEIIDQLAQGNFKGTDFTYTGGSYASQDSTNTNYICHIHINTSLTGNCLPEYGENQDIDEIIFSLDSLAAQTMTFQESGGSTLNFNRFVVSDSTTLTELAVCGTMYIDSIGTTDNKVYGRVTATGQEGSTINGNFQLDFCE